MMFYIFHILLLKPNYTYIFYMYVMLEYLIVCAAEYVSQSQHRPLQSCRKESELQA